MSYIVQLETRYENGDTNFGGNNLTYRILQLIKIRIAQKLGWMGNEDFAGVSEESRNSAEENEKNTNARLERLYQQAETWIPTQFKAYEEKAESNISW